MSGTPGPLAAGRRQPMWWGWSRAGELRYKVTEWLSRKVVTPGEWRWQQRGAVLERRATWWACHCWGSKLASTRLCDISLLSNYCWGSQWGSAGVQLQARGEQNLYWDIEHLFCSWRYCLPLRWEKGVQSTNSLTVQRRFPVYLFSCFYCWPKIRNYWLQMDDPGEFIQRRRTDRPGQVHLAQWCCQRGK